MLQQLYFSTPRRNATFCVLCILIHCTLEIKLRIFVRCTYLKQFTTHLQHYDTDSLGRGRGTHNLELIICMIFDLKLKLHAQSVMTIDHWQGIWWEATLKQWYQNWQRLLTYYCIVLTLRIKTSFKLHAKLWCFITANTRFVYPYKKIEIHIIRASRFTCSR